MKLRSIIFFPLSKINVIYKTSYLFHWCTIQRQIHCNSLSYINGGIEVKSSVINCQKKLGAFVTLPLPRLGGLG